MKPTARPAIEWLSTYTTRTFQHSGRKSLLLTGSRGSGKTTLIEALTGGLFLPGVRSSLMLDGSGQPRAVVLRSKLEPKCCRIGQREGYGPMTAIPSALDTVGAAMLNALRAHPSPWAVVDEIGFLEESSPAYLRELQALFIEKRVIAAIRKMETPFLTALREREDCLLLDLDEMEG